MPQWNPWHGCHKISEGCLNCYVYAIDAKFGKDSSLVQKTKSFNLPIQKDRKGFYKIKPGETVFACFSSDFFVEEADAWRTEAWQMIKTRSDLNFFIITKRIHRVSACLPADWGAGYDNVTIACTVENQDRADFRLPIYMALPLKNRVIICEPLLEALSLERFLGPSIGEVLVGGESGPEARLCDFNWVLDIRRQCIAAKAPFIYRQTGTRLLKDGKIYKIKRELQHRQAKKADIDTV